jgi:formamidopyrimidine-DNA glycosylase
VALMDQSRVAGAGNIYSNELCHLIHLHPETPANSLNRLDIIRLINIVKKLFPSAVAAGGTSFGDANTFRDIYGKQGEYQNYLTVYNRQGLHCSCGGEIIKYQLRNRSTFYCNRCQPLKR